MSLAPQTPVLIGAGVSTQRFEDPEQALDALAALVVVVVVVVAAAALLVAVAMLVGWRWWRSCACATGDADVEFS